MNIKRINDYNIRIVNPNDKAIYNMYINEISKYQPLSKEQEGELFKRIKATGDKQAIELICKHNLKFVVAVAKVYSPFIAGSTLTFEDLIGEGNVGITLAINKFDPNVGVKFISYAVWFIRNAILTCLTYNIKTIRLPSHISTAVAKLKKEQARLEQKLCRSASTLELFESMMENGQIEYLDSEAKIDEWFKMYKYESSLDFVIEETNSSVSDLVKSDTRQPYEELEFKERYEVLDSMLAKLTKTMREYFNDFYGLDGTKQLSIAEMAEKYDENASTIKNRIESSLRRLRIDNASANAFFFEK